MSDTIAKTCGNCKHGDIPPPKMSKHKVPRVLELLSGQCVYPAPLQPMSLMYLTTSRHRIDASDDATKCPCWEPKGGE